MDRKEPQETKKCAVCGGTILAPAVKCKHCKAVQPEAGDARQAEIRKQAREQEAEQRVVAEQRLLVTGREVALELGKLDVLRKMRVLNEPDFQAQKIALINRLMQRKTCEPLADFLIPLEHLLETNVLTLDDVEGLKRMHALLSQPPPPPRQTSETTTQTAKANDVVAPRRCQHCSEVLPPDTTRCPICAGSVDTTSLTSAASSPAVRGQRGGGWLAFFLAVGLGILGLLAWLAVSTSREEYQSTSQGTAGGGINDVCESARSEARELYKRCEKANSECGACLNGAKDKLREATCQAFCATNTITALDRLRQIAAAGCPVEEGPCR